MHKLTNDIPCIWYLPSVYACWILSIKGVYDFVQLVYKLVYLQGAQFPIVSQEYIFFLHRKIPCFDLATSIPKKYLRFPSCFISDSDAMYCCRLEITSLVISWNNHVIYIYSQNVIFPFLSFKRCDQSYLLYSKKVIPLNSQFHLGVHKPRLRLGNFILPCFIFIRSCFSGSALVPEM